MAIIKSAIKYNNWGDSINPHFFNLLFKEKADIVSPYDNYENDNYLIIGSILKHADEHSTVWGTGFISELDFLVKKPKKILAVRGPLTRAKLIEQGIDCPEVYGDPVLLLPRFYQPKIKKKYKLGIIPHKVDKENPCLKEAAKVPGVKILSIERSDLGFVDEVLECEKIASSSLHGLIVADAYGISSTWLEFSDKVIGNGFKFRDYFASVGRKDEKSLRITDKVTVSDIMNSFKDYGIKIDLDKLWNARPEFIE